MIENIKRIVNEHHTLIVVIIGVLVIYFLYWWFCCKDRPSTKKVKGGDVHGISLKFILEHFDIKVEVEFLCIGMNIDDAEGQFPVFALTEDGEEHVLKNNLNAFYNLINHLKFDGTPLKTAFEDPLFVLFGTTNTEAPAPVLIGEDNLDEFIYNYEDDSATLIADDVVDDAETKDFSLQNYLVGIEEYKRGILIGYYNALIEGIKRIPNFVRAVKFIGQPASTSFVDEGREKSAVGRFSANSIDNSEEQIDGKFYYWSSSRQSVFKKNEKELYDSCKQYVRNWYTKGRIMKGKIKHCCCCNEFGNIHDEYEKDDKTGYEVADIYPVLKLIMLVVLLIEYRTIFNCDDDDFIKIISSLVLVVNLFNLSCGVLMDKAWNDSVKNIYVYEYDNDIPNVQNDINPMNALRQQDTIVGFLHFADTNASRDDYFEALLNMPCDAENEIREAFGRVDAKKQELRGIISIMNVGLIDDVNKFIENLKKYGILAIDNKLYINIRILKTYLGIKAKSSLLNLIQREGYQQIKCNIISENIDERIKMIIDKSWVRFLAKLVVLPPNVQPAAQFTLPPPPFAQPAPQTPMNPQPAAPQEEGLLRKGWRFIRRVFKS